MKSLPVTIANMTALIEHVSTLTDFAGIAEVWTEAKEQGEDRETVREARDDLDSELDGATEAIEKLYALLKG